MEIRKVLRPEEIDLVDPVFWTRPLEEREGAFATLREEAPIRFQPEREMVGVPIPQGPG